MFNWKESAEKRLKAESIKAQQRKELEEELGKYIEAYKEWCVFCKEKHSTISFGIFLKDIGYHPIWCITYTACVRANSTIIFFYLVKEDAWEIRKSKGEFITFKVCDEVIKIADNN